MITEISILDRLHAICVGLEVVGGILILGLCVLVFLAILSRNSKASDYEEPTL